MSKNGRGGKHRLATEALDERENRIHPPKIYTKVDLYSQLGRARSPKNVKHSSSNNWRAGASLPSRFNGRFFSLLASGSEPTEWCERGDFSVIGEREGANLVVRTARFFRYLYITGAAYVVSNSTLHAHAHFHVKLQSAAYRAIAS